MLEKELKKVGMVKKKSVFEEIKIAKRQEKRDVSKIKKQKPFKLIFGNESGVIIWNGKTVIKKKINKLNKCI